MFCTIHNFFSKILSQVYVNSNNKGFLIGRYGVRNFIYTAMNKKNSYFITCYLATERKATKVNVSTLIFGYA